jgi:hypothetical protein
MMRRRIKNYPPMVDVLQIGSDGGTSLYLVKVNEIPRFELHMIPLDSPVASYEVQLRPVSSKAIIDRIEIRALGELWKHTARIQVAFMLQRRHPNAVVSWYTRG